MKREKMTIEICQRHHRLGKPEHNVSIIKDRLISSEADLLIFPEMFLTGYSLGRKVFSSALTPDDPLMENIRKTTKEHGKFIVIGFPRRSTTITGQVHNSAIIIGPDGVLGTYDKTHLVDFGPFEEWAYFTRGTNLPVFDVGGMKMGIIICYDIFFPELTKYYALKGADLVICISASPSTTRPLFEAVMLSRAIENTVYFAYSNLVGPDARMDFWGGGAIIGPKGNTLSKGPYFKEADVIATLERGELERARRSRPTLRDTRPEMLGALSNMMGNMD